MNKAIIQDNYQLSLPQNILEHFQPGQTFICVIKGDIISLVPKQDIQSVRGLLKNLARSRNGGTSKNRRVRRRSCKYMS